MDKVLIIAAHPDDEVLGCGGLLSKYQHSETEFKVIFLAEGTSCRYSDKEMASDEVQSQILRRNNFGINALKYVGVKSHSFYNLPCGRLDTIPILEINKIIEGEIEEFQPDVVFTHSENDANNDHRIINNSTIMATRPIPGSCVKTVFTYEISSSTEWNFGQKRFDPNYFIELSEQNVENKIAAFLCYSSEVRAFPFPRSPEGIKNNCINRGMQAGVKYAEAYKLIRTIV